MAGRADKGIMMTTGTFTVEAKKEARRDGAAPIELVAGEDLVKLLKIWNWAWCPDGLSKSTGSSSMIGQQTEDGPLAQRLSCRKSL